MKSNIKKSSKRRFYKNIIRAVPVLVIALIITLFVSITSVGAAEKKEEQTYKYYTSVQIMNGDTLWSIANEYCDSCDMDIKSYIKELMSLNKLTNDTINTGEYLIVFYYSADNIR